MTEEQAKRMVDAVTKNMYQGFRELVLTGKEVAESDDSFDEESFRLECGKAYYHYYEYVLKPHVFSRFPHLDLTRGGAEKGGD